MIKVIIGWPLIAVVPIILGMALTWNFNGSHRSEFHKLAPNR